MDGTGNGTNVTIEALARELVNPAWNSLEEKNSRVNRLMNSEVFCGGYVRGQTIKACITNNLLLFAVLHCPGDVK